MMYREGSCCFDEEMGRDSKEWFITQINLIQEIHSFIEHVTRFEKFEKNHYNEK